MPSLKSLAIVIMGLIFTGCSSPQAILPPLPPQKLEHVLIKNYAINTPRIAYIGEPIIKIKDFWLFPIETRNRKVDIGVQLSTANSNYSIPSGAILSFEGDVIIDGVKYGSYLLGWENDCCARGDIYYFKENRTPAPFVYVRNDVLFPKGMVQITSINPIDYKLALAELPQKISTETGYTNFEIIYSGRDNNSIKVSYREFTPENLARPAFYQEITYPIGSQTIRYKNLQIRVQDADGEKISYTVVNE